MSFPNISLLVKKVQLKWVALAFILHGIFTSLHYNLWANFFKDLGLDRYSKKIDGLSDITLSQFILISIYLTFLMPVLEELAFRHAASTKLPKAKSAWSLTVGFFIAMAATSYFDLKFTWFSSNYSINAMGTYLTWILGIAVVTYLVFQVILPRVNFIFDLTPGVIQRILFTILFVVGHQAVFEPLYDLQWIQSIWNALPFVTFAILSFWLYDKSGLVSSILFHISWNVFMTYQLYFLTNLH